ncbi:MAG: sulfatase-like hydrolase/transferase, partial [Acidobacteriota bacterium]
FQRAAAGSVRFDNVVAAAPWTAPSVATIMTGLWPPEHGYGYQEKVSRDLRLTRLTPEVRTLAEMLEARGYATTALVANPVLGIGSGLERGFERFELLSGRTSKLPLLTVANRLKLLPRELYLDAEGVRQRLESHVDALAEDPRPDFLWLHVMDPHAPLMQHPDLPAEPGIDLVGPELTYRREVRYTLAELARMIDVLEEHGLWRDSVFVMVADHGEMFAADDRGPLMPNRTKTHGHGHALFSELVRVPLLIRPPGGREAELRSAVLASHVDLLRTLEDLMGVDLPLRELDRYSLAPLLAAAPSASAAGGSTAGGPEPPPPLARPYALIGANHSGPQQRALRSSRHKLIEYEEDRLPPQLFDLELDPAERRNLIDRDSQRAEEMEEILGVAWGSLDRMEGEAVELDAETREQLRALGYVD